MVVLPWPVPDDRVPGSYDFVDQLFTQDVGMSAMLSQLTEHVEVHPPQREWPATVPMNDVVQSQSRRRPT
jgi:hypothetical protein